MHDHARYVPMAQPRARKTVPIATRLLPGAVAEIEETARSLSVPRHQVLLAIFRLGTPLAIAELTAKAQAAAEGVQP